MKHAAILLLLSVLLQPACRKRTESPTLTSIITQKSWKVSRATAGGTDFTMVYGGLDFSFRADSTLTVSDGTNNYPGTWAEDGNARKVTIEIVSSLFELGLISRDWDIHLITPREIQLRDDRFNPTQELWLRDWQ